MIADSVPSTVLDKDRRAASEQSFVRILALIAAALAALPTLLIWLATPPGSRYLGMQYNVDDHMVYAAWMRQAMDGRFLFDNRFAIDPQPGLTVHLYYLVLGWVAKVTGIALAMALARVVFSVAFVFLLYRLVRRTCPDVYTTKLAMALSVFGGGVGFLLWHTFGTDIKRPVPDLVSKLFLGRLPTDVWQPEGYVFPSMLTNGLFMVSLCLIVVAMLAFLGAREDWRWVPHGALAMFLLMNIHSYDALLVALVMVGLLVMTAVQRQLTVSWLARALVIGAGAIPAALWFVYVLRHDPVFQARAATPTFSANFRQVVFGYVGLMLLGLAALVARTRTSRALNARRFAGLGVIGLIFAGLFIAASSASGSGYFLGLAAWSGLAIASMVALGLVSDVNPGWNLAASWAVVGTIAPYFPALFQRKLSMGLAVPWAILAALAVGAITRNLDRSTRNLVLVLTIIVASASSFRWIRREFQLASLNVSNTTYHPVYLSTDAAEVIKRLNAVTKDRTVVLAMPGVQFPEPDPESATASLPDAFRSPYMPDLNPIISGTTGAYTYSGHWSETPDYGRRRNETTRFFLKGTPDDYRAQLLQATGANYVVAPVPQAFPALQLEDLRPLGEVIYQGQQFELIKVR